MFLADDDFLARVEEFLISDTYTADTKLYF